MSGVNYLGYYIIKILIVSIDGCDQMEHIRFSHCVRPKSKHTVASDVHVTRREIIRLVLRKRRRHAAARHGPAFRRTTDQPVPDGRHVSAGIRMESEIRRPIELVGGPPNSISSGTNRAVTALKTRPATI